MIRRMWSDLSEDELRAATPDPSKELVSFGEITRFDTVSTPNGLRQVPVTFEVYYEREGSGFGQKCWHRYKDNPSVLVAQHDVVKRDTVVQEEPYSADELAAMRSALPSRPTPVPDTTIEIVPRPDW